MKTESVIVVLATVSFASGANILAILGIPSPSHHIWNCSLMRALSARGHNITVLSVDEEKERIPNYSQYIMESAYDETYDFVDLSSKNIFEILDAYFEWCSVTCEKNIQTKGAKDLMRLANSAQFDLVIVNITAMDCLLGFIHLFNYPPVIGITAYSHPLWASYITGNPHNPAYIPELVSTFTDHMTFTQRVTNTLIRLYSWYVYEMKYHPETDRIIQENFKDSTPSIKDLLNRISLVMVNTHTSFDYARPLLPAVVEVGGMHIGSPQPLPKHLKKPMDASSNGFIFFSLGSNLRSDKLSAERRQIFLEVFAKLPYTVFWKWESDKLSNQPSNVIVGKWMPQRDILALPNIVLFISHCELLNTQESVYNGVPILGIPFFADQSLNARKAVNFGFGEKISFPNVTVEELLAVIQKMTCDTRYRKNAQRLSRLFRDQQQMPLEQAVFWTEYAIRHKGVPHLRSAGADLPWYQYLLLDVICALAMVLAVAFLLVYKICHVIIRLTSHSNRKKKKQCCAVLQLEENSISFSLQMKTKWLANKLYVSFFELTTSHNKINKYILFYKSQG